MDNELQTIENSIRHWTFMAETGTRDKRDYPPISKADILENCYLCEYSCEITGEAAVRPDHHRCQPCPYFKKYGFCNDTGKPFNKWSESTSDTDRQKHANAFVEQLKALVWEVSKDEVRKEAAEAEKPKLKLKDWDYGNNIAKCPYIVINGKIMWVNEGEFTDSFKPTDSAFTDTYLGHNLAKDLKALGKPLETFTIDTGGNRVKGYIAKSGKICLASYGGFMDIEVAEEISMNLRRLIHAAKARL
ncbi:MAG: hypothetical protein MUO31_06570 [Thermodesulfovibrionales bacterium]|nr:hypothetical protein [Thermodesulfovibrionales bacterium]